MPLIQVTMVEGRTTDQKHALIRELTDATSRALGVPADRVRVAVYEVSGDSWGIGGVPYSQLRGTPSTAVPPAGAPQSQPMQAPPAPDRSMPPRRAAGPPRL